MKFKGKLMPAGKIKEIRKKIDQGANDEALEMIASYLKENPKDAGAYREQADIYSLIGDREKEFESRLRIIENDPSEPCDYFDLARVCSSLGDSLSTVEYSKKCIQLCQEHHNQYYYQAAYFWLTYSYLKLKKYEEARFACNQLEDGFDMYIDGIGMKSKSDLLTDISMPK